ncbi:hypothetical protein [Flavobacterium sp. NRK F7]|uniref:hypothetical protein n=1 Tax=Flavobacterium sp. NRK F7 TaxID=2954930 RepID=UPI0020912962|nr:hypothetical protein [Flavobacterium sp. NRK F7]MCO6163945.1 hypothetical protein [Flavobacterium sp. NRK F7]
MKNLNQSKREPFEFHKNVVNSTSNRASDILYKDRLLALHPNISILYDSFIKNNAANDLISTLPYNYSGIEKEDLLGLYNFKRKLIQELLLEVTTIDGRIISRCQNCTINNINSFDHILPKEEFSEFSVNPLNLFPSCTECNSYKGKYWKNNGKPYFLNLYLDILPNTQYLFVNLNFDNITPKVEFFIKNINEIDPIFFSIIETHYDRLHLCERFSASIDSVISPLVSMVKASLEELEYSIIQKIVINSQFENQLKHGFNYWEAILTLALINHPDFLNYVKKS